MGLSEPSKEIQVSTLEEVPNGAPVDIRAEAKSSTELVVTWEPPPKETWNGELLGYHVGYQEVPPESSPYANTPQSYTFKSVEVRAHYGGEAILQGLSKYTVYGIIVQVGNKLFCCHVWKNQFFLRPVFMYVCTYLPISDDHYMLLH